MLQLEVLSNRAISPWLEYYIIMKYRHRITKITLNFKQQCLNQSNSSKGNELIFLFKISLPCEINKDSFKCYLNVFFSFKSIKKLSKLALWLSNNLWSRIADFLGILINLPVKVVIPRSDPQKPLTKKCFWFWP